ncbi:MAG: D-glycerate dehydrogenase [Parcubacteria group bacterium]|jgi:glyoxylate reductase|nr:D-glycerate dehydrogenase [Parcubacteria group bacterium]
MAKAKIFVTRKIPNSGIKLLKQKGYQVKVSNVDRVLTKSEIKKGIKGADAILCLLTDDIDGDIMDAAGPKLKIIANYAVGYNNIDVAAAKKRKILVTNTPGVLTDTVAEFAFSLMLTISKRIVEADTFTRQKKYEDWAPMLFLGSDLKNKTLGIVGPGRIGSALAERAMRGLRMNIAYTATKKNEQFAKKFKAKYFNLNNLLKKADVVSLHVPLLPSTKHLISTKQFKLMKNSAYLINTSRGPVINERALVKALKNQEIRGAALDVFEFEPKLTAGLTNLRNVVITPHIASATEETRSKMSEMAALNIIAVLSKKSPPNPVN